MLPNSSKIIHAVDAPLITPSESHLTMQKCTISCLSELFALAEHVLHIEACALCGLYKGTAKTAHDKRLHCRQGSASEDARP